MFKMYTQLRNCFLTILLTIIHGAIWAQTYPDRPVKIVVPIGAGSTTDSIARLVAEQLSVRLGQPFVVENKPGAAGAIGTAAVAKSAPDGYTLLIASSSHASNPVLNNTLPYNTVEDFSGISLLVRLPNILVTSPDKGYRSMKALVAYGQSQPGKLSYGSNGVGSGAHMNAELFRALAKFDAVHIAYKGSAELVSALISGQIDFAFVPITTALPFLNNERLVPLAVGSSERTPLLPNVPTTIEAGVAGSAHNEWIGFFARSGAPPHVMSRLSAEVGRILTDPGVVQRLAILGVSPAPSRPTELDVLVRSSMDAITNTVKLVGISKF
jgi:tripartite-type tricarboxylate transporter receptor subunit TctC